MKFKFKIQQYQTDAVDAVVRVFEGQPYQDHVSYRRDIAAYRARFPFYLQLCCVQKTKNPNASPIRNKFGLSLFGLSDKT